MIIYKKWPGLKAKLSISLFAFFSGSDSRLMDENRCKKKKKKKWPGLKEVSISLFVFIGGSDSRLMDENNCNCLILNHQAKT